MTTLIQMPKRNTHLSAGEILLSEGRASQALPLLREQLLAAPNSATIWSNLGICYRLLDDFQQAVDCFEKAMSMEPENGAFLHNFAGLLTEVGEFEKNLKVAARANELLPQNQDVALGYACARLREGIWDKRTWELYEFGRFKKSWGPPPGVEPWGGESLDGRTILVLSEGGYGDTFQFLPYIGKLKELGAIVHFAGWDKLKPLLEGHEWIDRFIPISEGIEPSDYDCCTSILSIQAILQARYSDNLYMGRGLCRPYVPEPHNKLRVGICWTAEEKGSVKKYRSLALEDLEPLKELDVEFVSLVPNNKAEWMLERDCNGWVKTVELIQNIDLVISVDTAIAHLACALNKPTWILLPPGTEWRWFTKDRKSPWYPTATLMRSSFESGLKQRVAEAAYLLSMQNCMAGSYR